MHGVWWSCSKAQQTVLTQEVTTSRLAESLGERRDERASMVESTIRARNVEDVRVLDAMRQVPRHEFVPKHLQHLAYSDRSLPIGEGQTISQPYIVALMTEWAALKPGDRCLEIGTGCGYQTAVLAEVGASIVSVEINPRLASEAEFRLRRLGYSAVQVQCHTADGSTGWPGAAPYDVIIVTAAAAVLPDCLLAQLADSGRMILPIGPHDGIQRLEKWFRRKQADGPATFESTFILNVQFVPLQSRT